MIFFLLFLRVFIFCVFFFCFNWYSLVCNIFIVWLWFLYWVWLMVDDIIILVGICVKWIFVDILLMFWLLVFLEWKVFILMLLLCIFILIVLFNFGIILIEVNEVWWCLVELKGDIWMRWWIFIFDFNKL